MCHRLILPSVRLLTAVSFAKRMLASMLAFPSHTVNREQEQGEGGGVVMEDNGDMKKVGAHWRRIKELGGNHGHLQPCSLYSYVLCALRVMVCVVCTCMCAPRIQAGALYCNQP